MRLHTYARSRASDPLANYEPTNGVISFHCDKEPLRLLRAPNQIGKTYAGIAEDWWFLTGTHPFRKCPPPPNKLWIMLADLDNQYREFCEKMHELEPPGVLAKGCKYKEGSGYYFGSARQIVCANGSQVVFRSGMGASTASASGTADALHIDEPPKPHHFYEAIRSVMHRDGPIWMTFTPVGRPVTWLKLRVEGDLDNGIIPTEKWSQTVPELTMQAVSTHRSNRPTRTRESIERQIRTYKGTEEEAQRLRGAWAGIATGRRFTGFNPTKHIFGDSRLSQIEYNHLRIGYDWGETPGSQIGYVIGVIGSKQPYSYDVLREIPGSTRSTPGQDAAQLLMTLTEMGIPHELMSKRGSIEPFIQIRGDINSAGKIGAGQSVNSAFADQLTIQSGYQVDVLTPTKRPGSVRAGEMALNVAALEDRLKIASTCHLLRGSLEGYTGAESDLKHPLDAVRYGIGDLLPASLLTPKRSTAIVSF